MMLETLAAGLPFFACLALWGYAEIHYKFPGVPSWYRRRLPEILADVPLRIDPWNALPVLVFVKDAHLFPISLLQVTIIVRRGAQVIHRREIVINQQITAPWWHRLFHVFPAIREPGCHQVDVWLVVHDGRRQHRFRSDNYRGTSHAAFTAYFSDERLPCLQDYFSGDLHAHSWYTSDQVEFGAPIEAFVAFADAMGLRFLAVTDHSYDLDDTEHDYLRNDPDLPKWRNFLAEVDGINANQNQVIVLPGEEISCGNARGQNVHLLALNNRTYVPGAGDSGEQWLRTEPNLAARHIVAQREQGALYFAAHVGARASLLEQILLRRGRWQAADLAAGGLDGVQIWNANRSGMQAGEAAWVASLLAGHRLRIIAGSDAHGNFNRFRQIGLPHLYMREHADFHLFGQHRTIAHLPGGLTGASLLSALRCGATSITSGPFLALCGLSGQGRCIPMGGALPSGQSRLELQALSSREMGALTTVRVYRGDLERRVEEVFVTVPLPAATYAYHGIFPLPEAPGGGAYFRAEVRAARKGPLAARALSNPIWQRP